MELINHTAYPHLLFRTGLEGNKFAAAVILRVSYDIINGIARPSGEQRWQLSAAPIQTVYGPMEGDFIFKRGGVDIMVFGSAIAPAKQPVKRMDVKLHLAGKINHVVRVIGDRFWKQGLMGLSITEPAYFTEMPLTLANAFGGWDEWDKLKFPFPNNPLGKGFIWHKNNAAGKPLPNIEDPAQLIAKWDDRPFPAGMTALPMNEKRTRKAAEFDADGNMVKFDPLFYNAAFNELVVKEVKPGEEIVVEGMTASGRFVFKVPEHRLTIKLSFDGKENLRYPVIDQIGLEPNIGKAFITYRYAFNYEMKPMTRRMIDILED